MDTIGVMMESIDLKVKHHFDDGVYAKEMHLPAHHFAVSHKHAYDHISMLHSGAAVVTVEGVKKIFTGPTVIMIRAHKEHRIDAITDVVWFCIHETNETDPEKIDEVAIERV